MGLFWKEKNSLLLTEEIHYASCQTDLRLIVVSRLQLKIEETVLRKEISPKSCKGDIVMSIFSPYGNSYTVFIQLKDGFFPTQNKSTSVSYEDYRFLSCFGRKKKTAL